MSSYQYPPPPPGGQPPTGYPQPGFQQPVQQPPYQQPPQQPWQQQPGGMYPTPPQGAPMPPGYGQPQPAAPPPATMPGMYSIDDNAMAADYRKAKEEMQRGGGAGFLKVPGPQGQIKWDSSVPIGYEGSVFVHICGPWAQNKPVYVRKKKYFWKSRSKPNGTSIIAPPQGDLVEQALEYAAQSPDPNVAKFVKDFGKAKMSYVYQVLQLDNPAAHIGQDGVMRPLILDEGKQLHTAIGDVFNNAEGASNIIDYARGRPVRLVKKKTGPKMMDIEWTAMPAMNPQPVPQEFWPALQNLWDLEKFVKYPTVEEMQAAIIDMGLPMPGQVFQSQVPMGYPTPAYNPGAAPPYQNPYQQPPQQPMQPQAPQGWQEPQWQQTAAPQQPVQQNFGPPPMNPPPVSSMGAPGQPQGAPPPNFGPPPGAPGAPPAFNPPPVSSANPQMPVMSGPPPVPGSAPAPQGPPPQQTQAMPPQQPQGNPQQPQGQAPQLSLPLAPGTKLPGDRERCFGGYNATDNWCIQCPDWVKGQCMRLSPQAQQPQQADGGLQALQQQLQG